MAKHVNSVLQVFAASIIRGYRNPRVLFVVCVLAVCAYLSCASPLSIYRSSGMTYNALEPSIALYNDFYVIILNVTGIIVLLCDAPFFENGEAFILYRVGRTRWLAGKLLYIACAIVLYNAVQIALATLMGLPGSFFSTTVWSNMSRQIASGAIVVNRPIVDLNIINAFRPGSALVQAFALICMYDFLVVMVMFFVNTRFKRIFGILAGNAVGLIGFAIMGFGNGAMFSPLHHAMLVTHNMADYYEPGLPTFLQSYFLLVGLTVLLMILAFKQIQSMSFRTGE